MKLAPFRTALAGLALGLSLPACAQPAKAANDADPALWVVKDADTTVYLFGTIHVLKPGLTWFDEAVKTAFDRSNTLVLEMVMPDTAAAQSLVMAKGIAPATDPKLSDLLPADRRAAFAKAAGETGTPIATMERMRPWLASLQLTQVPMGKLGYDAENGPETVLTTAAKAAGKQVVGLETFQQQIGYFDQLSTKAQVTFLTSTIDELPKLPTMMAEMVTDWSAGRPDKLATMMNDSLKDSPEVEKTLLVDRNARWAAWVRERMARPGTVFVAVGAGHLAGPNSVQAQLAKMGVKAERVAY